jgi:glucosylceramidase
MIKPRHLLCCFALFFLVFGMDLSAAPPPAKPATCPTVHFVSLEGKITSSPVVEHPCPSSIGEPELTVRVEPRFRGQTLEGIGGAFNEQGGEAITHLREKARERMLTALFDPNEGAGLNFCRVPIGASDFALYAWSLNDSKGDYPMTHFSTRRDERYLIPFIQAARAINPAMRLHACPWSPPGWLKTTGTMTNGGQLLDRPEVYRAHALYLRKFVEGYARLGIPIDRVFVQNEPNIERRYPTCAMPPKQMARFVTQYLRPEFDRTGVKSEIWAGTFQEGQETYAQDCMDLPGFRGAISGMGFQYSHPGRIQNIRMQDPSLKVMQTEAMCFDGENSRPQARLLFENIVDHFNAGCTVYTYWNMVLNETSRSAWDWRQNSLLIVDRNTGGIRWNRDFAIMALVGRTLKPGAKWVASAPSAGPNTAAFLNPDGSLAILLWNEGPRATCEIQVGTTRTRVELPADSPCAMVLPGRLFTP